MPIEDFWVPEEKAPEQPAALPPVGEFPQVQTQTQDLSQFFVPEESIDPHLDDLDEPGVIGFLKKANRKRETLERAVKLAIGMGGASALVPPETPEEEAARNLGRAKNVEEMRAFADAALDILPGERAGELIGGGLEGFAQVGVGTARALGRFDEMFGPGLASPWTQAADVLYETTKEMSGVDLDDQTFLDKFAVGLGSTLGFATGAGASKYLFDFGVKGMGWTAAALGAATGGAFGEKEAQAYGATPEQQDIAYYANALFGASEGLPLTKAFARIDEISGGAITRAVKKSKAGELVGAGIKGAIEEGLQEAFQSLGGNIVAMETYDPSRSLMENMEEAVQVGGSVGLLINLASAALGLKRRAATEKKISALNKEMQDEITKITGAEAGEIAGPITILSPEYLTLQQAYNATQERIAEAGKADLPLELAVRTNINFFFPSAEDRTAAWHGVTPDELIIREAATGNVKKNDLSGIGVNKELEGEGKTLDQRTQETPVVAAMTVFQREYDRVRLDLELAIKRDKIAAENALKEGNVEGAARVKKLQDVNEQKLRTIQALVKVEQQMAKVFKNYTAKLRHLFPGDSKFAIVSLIPGRMGNNLGQAGVYKNEAGEAVNISFLSLESLRSVVSAYELAKAQKAQPEVIAEYKRRLEREKTTILQTFLHELGHHYAFNKWAGLLEKVGKGQGTKEEQNLIKALQNDYMRYIAKILKSSAFDARMFAYSGPRNRDHLLDALQPYFDEESVAALQDASYAELMKIAREQLTKEKRNSVEHFTRESLKYLLNFDEYMAEEFSKIALDKKLVDPSVEPFFSEGYKDMRKMMAQVPGYFHTSSKALANYFLGLSIKGKLAQAAKEMGMDKIEMDPLKAVLKEGISDPATIRQYGQEQDKFNKFMDIGFTILQIAEQNPHIVGLQKYTRTLRAWKNEVNNTLARAEDTLTSWKNLGKDEQELLARALFDETMGQTFDGKRKKTPTHFTDEELAKYDLSPEALALRKKIKEDFAFALDQMEAVLVSAKQRIFLENPAEAAKAVAQVKEDFDKYRKQPYFPLMRFGNWVMQVRAKGPVTHEGKTYKEGELIEYSTFDTMRERNRAVQQARGEFQTAGKHDVQVTPSYQRQPNFSLQGMPTTLIEHLESLMGEMTKDQKDAFAKVKNDVLPEKSFRKQFSRRKRVHGYSMDAMRTYANYMTSFANHLGRVKYDPEFRENLASVADSAKAMEFKGLDATMRNQIYNHMNDHLSYVMNPVNEFVGLRAAAFFWYLGYNVKSAFVNLTQIPLVTYPYLASRFGDAKAASELAKANVTAVQAMRNPDKLDAELKELIETGLAESWLDESLATELALAASEPNLAATLPKKFWKNVGQKISHYGSLPFHVAEKLNRHVAAIATYRLARQSGQSHEQGIFEARKAVEKTQYEYARWARPRFMRGPVGGTIFVFMSYLQNTMYFALGGDPGAFRMLLMLFLVAGLQGLPFGEDVMDLYDGAMTFMKKRFGMKDPYTDIRTDLRKSIEEIGADPDLVLHGLSSSTFGLANVGEFMGWPIPNLDLSGSLSMGRIVPGTELLAPADDNYERFLANSVSELGGASVSGMLGVLQALENNHPDQWKRWEKAMPSAMRSISKAARYATRGEEATRNGYPIASFDIRDHQDRLEIAAMALGFMPEEVSRGWKGYIAERQAVVYYEQWKQAILRDWNYAHENKDWEAVKIKNKEIREYNSSVPFPEMKVGLDVRRRSYESYRRLHRYNELRIERSRASRRLSSLIQDIYETADSEDNEQGSR